MKNQKHISSLAFFISLVAALTATAGCVSTSNIPKPASKSDTLVVAPVVIIDGRYSAFTGRVAYQIKLEDIETKKEQTFFLSTESHGYNYIAGIRAGKYLIKEYTTQGMANNDARPIELNKYLIVENGKLTIFPGKLVIYVYDYQGDENRSYLYPAFREIDDKQMTRIQNFLSTDENYKLWSE